jgi:RNA polymerase sigma-70 factor (ECF subfamily)
VKTKRFELKTLAHSTDEDLLQLMITGHEDAFTTLYRRWQGKVYRFALQMTGSRTQAEEVIQDTFMVLIQEAERFDTARGSFSSYLYGIARNCVRRVVGRDRSFVLTSTTEPEAAAVITQFATEEDPMDELTRSETIRTVRQAVSALPVLYREVVVLCDLHEMSYVKAASVLGCSIGTVRSRLHRARSFLIQKLQGIENPEFNLRKNTRVRSLV